MLKSLLRDKLFLTLFFLTILIKIFSFNEHWVERYYTYGLYPVISGILRFLFGWLPFSFGDILYISAVLFLVFKTWKFLRILHQRKVRQYLRWVLLKKLLHLVLLVYLVFNIFWGLNYNRQGISSQLRLDVQPYTVADLDTITGILQARLATNAPFVDTSNRLIISNQRLLSKEAIKAYETARIGLPFLAYQLPSIKSSMFSGIGHYFGFSGYYNPFSGEAQINTTIPFFLKPFVTTHEIGHQLGYAKENEANFVAFLACHNSTNPEFRYSLYFEMYQYAIRELSRRDTARARQYRDQLHPQVKRDIREFVAYLTRSANAIEPWVTDFYDGYLKLNNQPKGKMTYNEVVAWLIAYQKKFGREAI